MSGLDPERFDRRFWQLRTEVSRAAWNRSQPWARLSRRHPRFVLSASGGLHGDVPMENLVAYFETRDRMGIPAEV